MPLSLIDELRTRVVNEYEREIGEGRERGRSTTPIARTLERNVEIFTKSDADRVCSCVFSMSLMSVKGEITLGFSSLLRWLGNACVKTCFRLFATVRD